MVSDNFPVTYSKILAALKNLLSRSAFTRYKYCISLKSTIYAVQERPTKVKIIIESNIRKGLKEEL